MGPPKDPSDQTPPSSSKSLPYRNGTRNGSSSLRTLYRISAQDVGDSRPEENSYHSVSTLLPTSPHLPPTPPGANVESSPPAQEMMASIPDVAAFRSSLVTPINQNSPPTPDNTPPRERNGPFIRPFLGTQSSITSTQAESFTTAREDLTSEAESDGTVQRHENGFKWPLTSVDKFGAVTQRPRQQALPRSPLINMYGENLMASQSPESFDSRAGVFNKEKVPVSETSTPPNFLASSPDGVPDGELVYIHLDTPPPASADPIEPLHHVRHSIGQQNLKRGKSLRERLLEAQSQDPSASTEKFAQIIGWNSSVPVGDEPIDNQRAAIEDNRRFSGVSTTSTVEAYVVETNVLPRRQTTLRHVNKHESLRSVSSPLPASHRHSLNSASDSPHRLVHKMARLSNQNRWSFGSEVSKSFSLASSAVLPKAEVIRVAVIPERSSSLSSSAKTSQRQSLSNSSGNSHSRKGSDNPPSSWTHKRAFSDTVERGRDALQAPSVPVRSSSLSAPTSRATSRANSITSEHLQVRRQQAEKDLRKTLDRMESERLLNSLRDPDPVDQVQKSVESTENRPVRKSTGSAARRTSAAVSTGLTVPTQDRDSTSNAFGLAVPGTKEWAALRPPSIFDTPFSQPSYQSASPEINEARAINYFAHNNHSLQLIEPFSVSESRAVRAVQKQNLPEIEVDSPLRNPREPPEPPLFKIIPPTPAHESDDLQLSVNGTGTLKRPGGSRHRSESFISSISRNLSLKNARNRKADQDLDKNLHPMWRPRAFWDDIDNARPEGPQQERSLDRGIVNNSLGLPQERLVVTGPMALIRRLSERRKQNRGIVKQSSHSSLAKFRAGRKFHRSSSFLRFSVPLGVKDIQERILHAKQRKEDERRERRRAELRRSIGANVVPQGDSRFPASNTSLAKDI